MNTPFQDTKIDFKNIKLYKERPEQDFTKNIYPELQKQIINLKKKSQKSLSPDTKQQSKSIHNPSFINTSKSQVNLSITTKQEKQSFLPPINNLSSSTKYESKLKFPNWGETSKHQSFSINFTPKTEVELVDKSKMKTIFQENKFDQDRSMKLEFLKNKYENSMKNTYCLRNKSKQQLVRSMKEISMRKEQSLEKNGKNNQDNQSRNQLGIFLSKKNIDNQNNFNSNVFQNGNQISPLKSTYKYDKIYKMYVEQQIKQQQQYSESNKSSFSSQFAVIDKPSHKKSAKSEFRLKTIENSDYVDQNNTQSSAESEESNQLSPILQYGKSPKQALENLQQKLQKISYQQKKEYLTFLNNPLSLQGATLSSPSNSLNKNQQKRSSSQIPQSSQILQQSQIPQPQQQPMFNHNVVQKIFVAPLKQNINDKVSCGSQNDISFDEQNMSQDLKKSFFSASAQQSQTIISKPILNLTQSNSKRVPSQTESLNSFIKDNESNDNNRHKKSKSTKVNPTTTTNEDENFSRYDLITEQEESELCSSILNINAALDNIHKLQQNESIISQENTARPIISLQKINSQSNLKKDIQKRVDFSMKDSKFNEELNQNEKLNQNEESSKSDESIEQIDNELNKQESQQSQMKFKALSSQSIMLKTDMDEDDFNSEYQLESKNHNFTFKKTIDFQELKELRDKTINRLISPQKSSHSGQTFFSSRNISPHKVTPSISQKTSPLKIKINSDKFDFVLDEKKLIALEKKQSEKKQPEKKHSEKKQINSERKQINMVNKSLTKIAENKDQKKVEQKQKIQNLKKLFKKGNKKSKGKRNDNQDQLTIEEKQKEQDIKIADKLDQIKDKLRMTVKLVIRQQIQKKIQSTLSQNVLNNEHKIDEDVNELVEQTPMAEDIKQIESEQTDRDMRQSKQLNENNEIKEEQELTESQELKESKKLRESRNLKDIKEHKELQEPRSISRESKERTPSKRQSRKLSIHSQNSPSNRSIQNNPSLNQKSSQHSKNPSIHQTSSKQNDQNIQGQPSQSMSTSRYQSNQNQQPSNFTENIEQRTSQSPTKKTNQSKALPQNPTYEQQQEEVQEYSSAIMNFFTAVVDNMKDNTKVISHEFQLKNIKGFNETLNKNIVETFAQELKNNKMSDEDVERFKYIYEINAKMHIFYKGIVQLLGGINKLRDLVTQVIKKISIHLTLLPVNHQFSYEQMHRHIIPGICALLCDDHPLFYQTLKTFMSQNNEEFSFIDFYFVKKYIYSFLTKQKKNEISLELVLSIMKKVESVRRYIFPITILVDPQLRENVALKLYECDKFMNLFSPQFQLKQLKNLINKLYDYFYNEGEDPTVLDFNPIRKAVEPFLADKMTRKIFDYIEAYTQQQLSEDPFSLNVILRDLHYKFTKIRLRFGFKQGVFGIIKFEKNHELIEAIEQEIQNSEEYGLLSEFDEKESERAKDIRFMKNYLRFLLCEKDIFSVYDVSVSMSYFGVTHKIFKFWVNCLHSVLLTKYDLQPFKVQIFIKFVEACCPTS